MRKIRVIPRLKHGKIVVDFRSRFPKEEVPSKKLLEWKLQLLLKYEGNERGPFQCTSHGE